VSVDLAFLRLDPADADVALPAKASPGASGLDVRACVREPVVLQPGQRAAVPTGLAVEIPPGYELQVRSRSGLALAHGVTCLNSPGTIDSDYRGEIRVILANLGSEPFHIERGARIAQLVLAAVADPVVRLVERLGDTERGSGGFGSTGR
jgi:dUTP pyrophosphatase